MNRSVKLAAAAALGGLAVAVAIVTAMQPPSRTDTIYVPEGIVVPDPHADERARCGSITVPETSCDAFWAAERRRFFSNEGPDK